MDYCMSSNIIVSVLKRPEDIVTIYILDSADGTNYVFVQ